MVGGVYWGDFPGGGMSEFSAGGGSSPHSLPVGKTLLFGHFFCDLSKKKLFLCMLLRQFMLTSICIKNADITIFLCIIDNSRAEECLDMKTIFLILSSIDVTLSRNLKEYTKSVSFIRSESHPRGLKPV